MKIEAKWEKIPKGLQFERIKKDDPRPYNTTYKEYLLVDEGGCAIGLTEDAPANARTAFAFDCALGFIMLAKW